LDSAKIEASSESTASIQTYELARLEALRRYEIVEAPTETVFSDLTRLAAWTARVPQSGMGLVERDKVLFVARQGIELEEVPRDASLCEVMVHSKEMLMIPDTTAEERFRRHPLLQGADPIRFFAGVPLINLDGFVLGALCVMGRTPQTLDAGQIEALKIIAHQMVSQLEYRKNLLELSRTLVENQRTEDALKESELFYHSLVESIPQNLYRKDQKGRFTFANKRFCESIGKPLEAILGKTDFDLFPEDLARKYQQDDEKIMRTGETFETVEAHHRAQGQKSYVHVVKSPIVNFEREILGTQGIFWDVTDRKQTEEDLAYERELLRSFLDNVPDSVYFKDVKSRFIRCSQAMARMFQCENADAAIGKTDFDFFTEEHARQAFEDEQRIILTGQPLLGKVERETWPDGRVTYVISSKMPFRNKDGAIIGTIGISKDITELKKAEAELELARDAALESTRLKSEFLANMSHEIRTPMNAIIGMAGLLIETPLDDEQKDFADTIRSSADALLTVINDILDFSKIEAGKLRFEQIGFDLVEMVESAVDLVAPRAQAKDLELALWLQPDLKATLVGDPGRIRQVLLNLMTNAVKFTEQGEILVKVTLEDQTETHARIRFSVVDTGIGINAQALPLIFQAFIQADGSMTRKYGGTGLGLAISKQLVEMMGGQIGVDSALDKGSTFWFEMNLAKQPEVKKDALAPVNLAALRVLVVDDNATNRQIVRYQVRSWRLECEECSGGVEALACMRANAARGKAFDVAILDQQMPEMDGVTLAKCIKTDPAINRTRLIMLTSMGHRLDQEKINEAGLEAFLVKPVKKSRLYDCLASVMAAQEVSAETQRPDATPAPAPAADTGERRKTMRILLAEDNPVNQKVALRQLSKLGYAANAVANGLEVLDALKSIPYEVVFMDCQMPEMDGYEATRRLRQKEADGAWGPDRHGCYVIALTAHALQGDREKCLAAGMNDYISKPVQMADLLAVLERAQGFFTRENPAASAPGEAPAVRSAPILPPPLDPAVLQGLRELQDPGEPDPVTELVDLFIADASPRLERMKSALAGKDLTQLTSQAHSLKGSAGNLGARHLAGLCAELEKQSRAGETANLHGIWQSIWDEFERVKKALAAERRQGGV